MPLDSVGEHLLIETDLLDKFVPVPMEVLIAHKKQVTKQSVTFGSKWRERALKSVASLKMMYTVEHPPAPLMSIINEIAADDRSVRFRIGYHQLDPYILAEFGPDNHRVCLGIYENGKMIAIAKRRKR